MWAYPIIVVLGVVMSSQALAQSTPAATPSPPAVGETPVDRAHLLEETFRATTPPAALAAENPEASVARVPASRPTLRATPLPRRRPSVADGPAQATATPRQEPRETRADMALSKLEPPQLEAPFGEAPRRRVDGRPFSDRRFPVGRAVYLDAIKRLAEEHRVPIDLVDAVMSIESGYDPHAVGPADEIGLMQVRPGTARQLGFEGDVQALFDPENNIALGVRHLSGAWERAGGRLCEALMKYRTGWDETRMSALSFEYCRRAHVHLTAIASPLARGVDVAALARAARPSGPQGADPPGLSRALNGRVTGRFNWADHDRRLRDIDARFGGSNFGIIAR